jgi:hypothetical protein
MFSHVTHASFIRGHIFEFSTSRLPKMPEKAEAKKMNVNIQADIADHAKSHKAPLTGKYESS